jgi:hypothetical protein
VKTWHHIRSLGAEPLVVVQQASAGAWEKSVLVPPPRPARFWLVAPGALTPVLPTSSGLLVSPEIARLLLSAAPESGTLFDAVVEAPQGLRPAEEYLLVRPHAAIHLKDRSAPSSSNPQYAYIAERPMDCVFNAAFCAFTEASGVTSVRFVFELYA